MTHIEFFGPPGSGKSKIFQMLLKNEALFGGTEGNAIRRIRSQSRNLKHVILNTILPEKIQQYFESNYLEYRYYKPYVENYLKEYPSFIEVLSEGMDLAKYQKEKIVSLPLHTASQYQIGYETVNDDEILCMDEGFVQRLLGLFWRGADCTQLMKKYCIHTPTPRLVIYLDAPPETCLNRQNSRGSVTVEREWVPEEPIVAQTKLHQLCDKIHDGLNNETNIIRVDNTGDVNNTYNEIKSSLEKQSIL